MTSPAGSGESGYGITTSPRHGVGVMEELIDIVDHINNHRTILDFKGHKNPTWMGPEYGDVRFLSKKAK